MSIHDSGDPRQRLVAAAETQFRRFGYRRTTIEDITAEADTGKGSLFNGKVVQQRHPCVKRQRAADGQQDQQNFGSAPGRGGFCHGGVPVSCTLSQARVQFVN